MITVYFPTVAILNEQFGCVLNFPTHGPHVRVWTYKLVPKTPEPLSGQASPALVELVFDTRVALISRILCMPWLNLNAYSWCVAWWIILFGRIMTLLHLGPPMVGWAPLEGRPLTVLCVGVTTYFLLVWLWHSSPLNLVIILDNFLGVTIISLIVTPSNNFLWLCLFRLNK